jgi:hypothetical protein
VLAALLALFTLAQLELAAGEAVAIHGEARL